MRTRLDELDGAGGAISVHPLGKLEGEQLAKERANTNAGEEVAAAADGPSR